MLAMTSRIFDMHMKGRAAASPARPPRLRTVCASAEDLAELVRLVKGLRPVEGVLAGDGGRG